MRRVSMATQDVLVGVSRERYGSADHADRSRILDEFVAVTGFIASTRCGCCGRKQHVNRPALGPRRIANLEY